MERDDVVIVGAKRTPMGNLLGSLAPLTAPELGAFANRAAIAEAGIDPREIDEVITGCVLQAGIGQAPARQASLGAGIPDSAGATTLNKMCGSGMKAVMTAHDLIVAGSANIVLAGGMESMSNAPYLLAKARAGYRLGHGELKDHLFLDGLEDAYEPGRLMGVYAEDTASHFGFTRAEQDAFAERSMKSALLAQENGAFAAELVPVTIAGRKGDTLVDRDESPDVAKLAKIAQLRPAFKPDGTVTAANSSSISDGAASLVLMRSSEARARGLRPLARIVAQASHAQEPRWFTTAPVDAIRKVMARADWTLDTVDLFEINEAFAVVAMAAIRELSLDINRVNIHGGACALGHPIGASGARILVTLIRALERQHLKRGVAALCIGGGEATAIAVERL
ncbi:acetyl-CoA C-acyltransferase [Legionella geestiana]|uniref:acetyl-CoA C-acyltransferase n=1 Tax=Legionella geestiana TaxID=45065 RepID=UPI00109261E3|nr:acetyl-CoA C-acyltransferase [Legionella geestiana]QDQ40643.1 acetyl-CoA C-acyltransferase [Legionella geestiana]